MNQPIVAIIQARTGSTRLPNKMLMPFADGKTILEIIVGRLQKYTSVQIVLATTVNKADDALADLGKKLGINVFRGDENDVLKRFIDAASNSGAQRIIRICADNPFLNAIAFNQLISFVENEPNVDYVGFWVNERPSIKTHFGFWAEYVSLSALEKVSQVTKEKFYHEHVTNYIYEHPDDFTIKWIGTYSEITRRDDIRLTIDTQSDFETAKEIYRQIYTENENPAIENIISYLSDKTEFLEIMKREIDNNSK